MYKYMQACFKVCIHVVGLHIMHNTCVIHTHIHVHANTHPKKSNLNINKYYGNYSKFPQLQPRPMHKQYLQLISISSRCNQSNQLSCNVVIALSHMSMEEGLGVKVQPGANYCMS